MLFGVTDYAAFVFAFLLLLALPGPGNLALILSTGRGGVRAGLASTLGIILGDQVLMWLAVAGVAALLQATPAAFHLVQWLGAAYLVWLGARMLLARPGAEPALRIVPRHYLKQALVITVFNPKAIVFYMAFFPLFIDPLHHLGLPTFAFMALTIAVLTLLYGMLVVFTTRSFAQRLRGNPRVAWLLEKIAGLCLVAFGIKLTLR